MNQIMKMPLILSVVLWLAACSDTPDSTVGSDVIVTNDIHTIIQLVSDGGQDVQVQAQFTVEIPPSPDSDDDIFIDFAPEDEVLVTTRADFESLRLSGDDIFDELDNLYDTYVPLKKAATIESAIDLQYSIFRIYSTNIWYTGLIQNTSERAFQIPLNRDIKRSATGTRIVLPDAFSLQPIIGPISRSSNDVALTWSPIDPDAQVNIRASTTCTTGNFETYVTEAMPDVGAYTIPAGTLQGGLSGTCNTTLRVEKFRVGELDSAYAGGIVVGYEIRSVSVQSVE